MKPWHEKPLWEKVFLSPHGIVYVHAGRIIGHLGCSGFAFYDQAKLLPNYDKLRYENAVRDLTVYVNRERGEYVLHQNAKKVLRIIIGPEPTDPEYAAWWRARLVSVEHMKEAGRPVEWAAEPPVPLGPPKPKKVRSRRRK